MESNADGRSVVPISSGMHAWILRQACSIPDPNLEHRAVSDQEFWTLWKAARLERKGDIGKHEWFALLLRVLAIEYHLHLLFVEP